ncbi:complex I intermediate-associated protein 30, mitochondrial [Nematolebias whitei]|uniref:complex I intermediate-associated protein 30, mitochondrial n=1 Tax=Nematolebias whitei TaxID=451745 RepID=UPI0018986E75|nr:complex I intermediate-associated protein 30, mitochondrial [Nematolebias whitei]XP_037550570.1 complex I intermediate-associated protein 30, mitochondrial [Nematolebias whitei]
MALLKTSRLPPLKLLSSIYAPHLLLRSITPGPLLRTGLNQSTYHRPGQPKEKKFPWENIEFNLSKGVKRLKRQFRLLFKLLSDPWIGPEGKPLVDHMLEQNRVLWEFRGPESLQEWIFSSDEVIGGQSRVYLKLGKNNTCFLYGTLCSVPPNDGETDYSGYCTLRSRQRLGWLDRKKHFDLSSFNTLHLRIRGDGHQWMIIINSETYFSHHKDDLYVYFLYTRGGPYWQDVKIPFSKFFLTHKGRIQDRQHPLALDKINTIGFTLADKADGPFQLEIDFIGVSKDYAHTEDFAYETYQRNPEV